MKTIYFVRHGIATEKNHGTALDPARQLTENGKSRLKKGFSGFFRLKNPIEVILTSPYVRAVETAEIVGEILKPIKGIEPCDVLKPGHSLTELKKMIRNRKEKSIVLVGHEPSFSEWIAGFLKSNGTFEVKKGSAIQLEWVPDNAAKLVALLPPKALRLMARKQRVAV